VVIYLFILEFLGFTTTEVNWN